jgi:hypothetical protein
MHSHAKHGNEKNNTLAQAPGITIPLEHPAHSWHSIPLAV